ncbi:MAG: PepSY-associated TM helix domain-containing protein [bacterium]
MPPRPPRAVFKAFYRWTRDLHLYLGLFVSPFVLVYAVSAIQFNHTLMPWGGVSNAEVAREERVVRVVVSDSKNSLEIARQVRQQIDVRGEIGYVRRKAGSREVRFPIETPGHVTTVDVDLSAGTATIQQRSTGVWDGLTYLHKMPGPHNATVRGNWLVTRFWGWTADVAVYLILFLTASGVYLWTVLRADRRTGMAFLGAGLLSFVAIIVAIVA